MSPDYTRAPVLQRRHGQWDKGAAFTFWHRLCYYRATYTCSQAGYIISVLAVLQHFGYDIENLYGSKVHSLSNVMTVDMNIRSSFERLTTWFEKTVRKSSISLWFICTLTHTLDSPGCPESVSSKILLQISFLS